MPPQIPTRLQELLTHKKTIQSKIKDLDTLLSETYSLYAYHQALLQEVVEEIIRIQKNNPESIQN